MGVAAPSAAGRETSPPRCNSYLIYTRVTNTRRKEAPVCSRKASIWYTCTALTMNIGLPVMDGFVSVSSGSASGRQRANRTTASAPRRGVSKDASIVVDSRVHRIQRVPHHNEHGGKGGEDDEEIRKGVDGEPASLGRRARHIKHGNEPKAHQVRSCRRTVRSASDQRIRVGVGVGVRVSLHIPRVRVGSCYRYIHRQLSPMTA